MEKLNERDINSIVSMLYDLDILYENNSDDLKDEIERSFDKKEICFMEWDESLVIFFNKHLFENKKEKIFEKCKSLIQQSDNLILLFEIENSFENFMSDDEVEELRNELNKKTKVYKRNIKYTNYALTSANEKRISIPVKDMFNSMENSVRIDKKEDNEEEARLYNYNFIVGINEIVKKLYGNLGNKLFDKNVRYEVEGAPGKKVEESIKNTYKEEPQMFFFKNNGISLYIKDRKKLKINTQAMEITLDTDEPVSVINGAQTITAVSKVLSEEYSDACVLLRIYTLDGNKINIPQNKINDVTVALNQQKPINNEDIAMLSSFVIVLNNEYEKCKNNVYAFSIVKRGDTTESIINHHYFLKSFAQKAIAVIKKDPGKARTRPTSILKLDEDNNLEEEIFKVYDDDETKNDEIFNRFKPINLAFSIWEIINDKSFWGGKVKDEIGKVKDDSKEDDIRKNNHVDSFIKYGRYLVLSILTNVLLGNFTEAGEEKNNYENDGWKIKKDKEDELIKIICSIYSSFNRFFKKENQLDSNNFKTTKKIYNCIIKDMEKDEQIKKYSNNIVVNSQ